MSAFPIGKRTVAACLGFFLALCSVDVLAAEKSGAAGETRTVNAKVLNVDGTPLAGAAVELKGIDRPTLGLDKTWTFKTDGEGRFTAEFVNRRLDPEGDDPKAKDTSRPGWGLYYFLVPPDKEQSGAVSGPVNFHSTLENPEDEWGKAVALDGPSLEVVLRMKKGIVVEGVVLDLREKPLSGVKARLFHDLHADSHTGLGGEIFERSATSGADGRFRFDNVYPVQFALDVEKPAVWLKTQRGEGGEWVDNRIDVFPVKEDETRVWVGIEGSTNQEFKVYGTLVDAKGKPVPGGDITVALSYHKEPETFRDSHTFVEGKTGPDGKYEVMLETPWIRFIQGEKGGMESAYAEAEPTAMSRCLPPGKYDLRLEAGAPRD
ncbi:MAG: carboxypeptidase-like regulatory domain-containing protein [Candidatus Sumerlaeota bacterium]|nr:carboxypeptidase-like regulatory domain-containing protein [Candidatus Sumerlaeota bacterium]